MKFAIRLMIGITLLSKLCAAGVVLRFQSAIDSTAKHLSDVLLITNDVHHWSQLPLLSHPNAGQFITQEQIITWMRQQVGPFDWTWEGKTRIQVKQPSQTSGLALLNKAKAELIHQLKPQYKRIEVKALSQPKDSDYRLEDFTITINNTYPSSKRVCVWLINEKKRIPIWFEVSAHAEVSVAKHNAPSNTLIQSKTFTRQVRNIAGLKGQPAKNLPQKIWLKHPINKDQVLLANQLIEPPLVTKGQSVKVHLQHNTVSVIMDAVALADGFRGQNIPVKNPLNQQSFIAKITDSQKAEVIS